MVQIPRYSIVSLVLLVLLAACGGAQQPAAEAPTATTSDPTTAANTQPADEPTTAATPATEATAATPPAEATSSAVVIGDEEPTPTPGQTGSGDWTTPHPIIGDANFRKGFAYCTNRPQLIQSVYPFLEESQQQQLLMDTFLPQGHWALAPQDAITTYPYDPQQGIALLEQAGWTEVGPDGIRTNAAGDRLSLKLTTTNAQFRQTWATVLEQQVRNDCGIELVRIHTPGAWWFGDTTGLQVRDFELGAYAWVGQADPGGTSLYACNQIPLPSNNWEGQNYMGWCNEDASRAILAANNTLDRAERVNQFGIVQREFTADMVSLPLFNRLEAAAATVDLLNFEPNATSDSYASNIDEWELADGGDTVVLGFTQEPASLFLLVESASVANIAASLLKVRAVNSYDYDYQPAALAALPLIENGGTVQSTVDVAEGDTVWSLAGEAVELAPGAEVIDASGNIVTYEGGPLQMSKLAVTFQFPDGLTWEDGVPVTAADMQLAHTIDCDPTSGGTTYTVCESMENVEVTSDTSYTITYLPGALWSEYFAFTLGTYSNLFSIGAYPAHREISPESLELLAGEGVELPAGSTLADVPPAQWSILPEVAEQPYSYGPYRIVSWEKGQRMTFEANPYYFKGEPAIKTIVIQFFADTNQAVAQLLTGDVDVLGRETLGAGPELQTVLDTAEAGLVQARLISSPTWEHIDFNLFTP